MSRIQVALVYLAMATCWAGWLPGWLYAAAVWLGWLAGWLDGWMDGWLDGWLVTWLAGWLFTRSRPLATYLACFPFFVEGWLALTLVAA